MILAFLFSIQTFLKQCKALRTEKYKRYINIFIIFIIILLRSRSVAISFLKLQHWKVQSNARVFCSQRTKAPLTLVVHNEAHLNEF